MFSGQVSDGRTAVQIQLNHGQLSIRSGEYQFDGTQNFGVLFDSHLQMRYIGQFGPNLIKNGKGVLSFPGGAEIEGTFVNDELALDQPLTYKGYMLNANSSDVRASG